MFDFFNNYVWKWLLTSFLIFAYIFFLPHLYWHIYLSAVKSKDPEWYMSHILLFTLPPFSCPLKQTASLYLSAAFDLSTTVSPNRRL
ncbi:unnamed protein product [Trifolium pratense]|uniref:Uncharacterized protein n=1 Tax=Trifolium pratense TaxID=57577 RepID=A0ACB0JBW9_TRIPR|nr:unnamed protein product [Trifolium pratense]